MKNRYVLQAYKVGSKKAQSLGLVIPRGVADEYNITTSSVLLLQTEIERKKIVMQVINEISENQENVMMSAEKNSLAPRQQISSEIR
jgi:hypothetical protein